MGWQTDSTAKNRPLLAGRAHGALSDRGCGIRNKIALVCGVVVTMLLTAGVAHAQLTATIRYVGSATSPLPSSTTTTVPIVVPAGVVAGDVMIALETYNPNGSAAGPSSGWTFFSGNNNGTIGGSVWYRVATSADVAGSTTYTWTSPAGSRAGGFIMAFRGVDNSNPLVTYATQASTSGTNRTAPSLTPGITNTMLLAAYAVGNGTADTLSSPSGMTQATIGSTTQSSSGVLVAGFYKLLSASSATGALVSQSGSSLSAGSIGFSVALKPATVAPLAVWHTDETAWTGVAGEVLDSSGNGYNGVAVNGATTAGASPAISGANGTCYYGSFNGSSQYVQLPTSLGHLGSTMTITTWIRPTSASAGRIYWDDYNYDGYALSFNDPGSNRIRFYSRLSQSSTNFNNVDSAISLTIGQWYFVAITMDALSAQTMTILVYNANGTLLDSETAAKTSFQAGTGPYSTIGGNATSSYEGTGARFPGNIDEVILYNTALTTAQITSLAQATHPCTGIVPNHYAVSDAGSAVNCTPAPVTVTAHNGTHTPIATADTISLSTSTGHGDWTMTTGNGVFVAGSANSGAASYTYSQADNGSVVLALRDTYAETVTIGVTDGTITAKSGTAQSSEDSPLIFAPSGFRVTNGSNIAATIGTQVAGVTSSQSLALQAVRTDTNTGACTNIFPSGTTATVSLAFQCNNPAACVGGQTMMLSNNGTNTSLASNSGGGLSSYTSVPLKFSTANAEAPITINYSDVGQITLAAKYTLPLGSGAASGNSISGAAQFVVQPYSFTLSAIKSTASGAANPAASTATGGMFIAAGQPFSATVTAVNALGVATPNFGQELSPAAVSLTPTLVLPTSGNDPPVAGSFGTFSSGVATGTNFSWPEVGIIILTPVTANYLSTGTVSGAVSGNVGRFIPNGFAVALNTPLFAPACAAGGFTYVGQPFGYAVSPVITVTAQALGGTTTQNYSGSLFRLTNASLTGRAYTPTPATPALSLNGLPATTSDPTIASSGGGVGSLTFSSGTGIAFARGGAIAPFNANIALMVNVIDADGAAASANPVTFGASGGIGFTQVTNSLQYFGRLALGNALGSELLDLPMPLTVQYYVGNSVGFATNTADSCTSAPAIGFSNYQLNLSAGKTCVRDSGSPGASGAGCAAPASASIAYRSTPVSGNFNLTLAAPGSGNSGAVTITPLAPAWLQYPWNSAGNSSPSGLAAFGVFPGPASRIYQREIY